MWDASIAWIWVVNGPLHLPLEDKCEHTENIPHGMLGAETDICEPRLIDQVDIPKQGV